MSRGCWIALGVAGLASSAFGQSFNIDFGSGAGVPADTFPAEGRPGVWNAVDDIAGPIPLLGLDGAPTGVVLDAGLSGESNVVNDPATEGEDERLMDDFLIGVGDQVRTIAFQGLENGFYQIATYGWTPSAPDNLTSIWLDGRGGAVQTCGGEWPGGLLRGVTHAVHLANIVNGTLVINIAAGDFRSSGNVNGIQLIRLGNACRADWNNDGVANSQDFFDFLSDFFADFADFNNNGVTDSQDFFDFLGVFFVGC